MRWLLLLLAVAGCSSPGAAPATVTLDIRDFEFQTAPGPLTPGDTLRWTNRDFVPHAVATEGVVSPLLEQGDSWEMVVTESATITCPYHPAMEGRIQVQ